MRCPLCTDEVLQPHLRNGIEVDVCPRCRGVWLDRGELGHLVDASPTQWAAGERSPDRRPGAPAPGPGDRKARKKRLSDRLSDVFEELIDL
jgi:uncharacterized protein